MKDTYAMAGRDFVAVDRRKLIGGMVALGAAGAVASPAMAAVKAADPGISAFRAVYALRGSATINGFFAAPKGKTNLDVVLVMPMDGASAEDIARRYASNGYFAIAPDFAKPQGAAPAVASRDAKVAELMRAMPGFKRLMQGSGRVTVATA